jgi:O-acetyl-ADP-ribose deacetylase (regulator of RNase III)
VSMSGGVSAALNGASGFALQEEARRFRPVRHGGVIVTPAGRLRARFVLHGITIEFGATQTLFPSRDILRQILSGCVYHANTLGLTSLAIPLLGTGTAGFPPEACLDTMMSFLIDKLMYGAHTLQRVDVVLYWRERPVGGEDVVDSEDTTRPRV